MTQEEILKSPKLQMEAALIRKCSEDPDFRSKVLENPKGMLEQALGQKLPENLSIFVHQENLNTLHFSIPPARASLEQELSDEQLEQIAGGTGTEVMLATILVATLGASIATGFGLGATVSIVTNKTAGW
jgi:hypothetical protein